MTAMPMTTDELRDILDLLQWSQGDLSRWLGRDLARTRKMCRGREPIDEPLAEKLRAAAAAQMAIPEEYRKKATTSAALNAALAEPPPNPRKVA